MWRRYPGFLLLTKAGAALNEKSAFALPHRSSRPVVAATLHAWLDNLVLIKFPFHLPVGLRARSPQRQKNNNPFAVFTLSQDFCEEKHHKI